MDISIRQDDGLLNVRVAGVILDGAGRLLLQGDPRGTFLIPPGGRCKLHEDSRAALARELEEELGAGFVVGRLLWVVENFFGYEGVRVHEYTFVYLAHVADAAPMLTQGDRFDCLDGVEGAYFRWVPANELAETEIYPEVLRTRCGALPRGIEHVVVRT